MANIFRNHGLILALLVSALLVRLPGIGFGLPALLDPDEPFFVLKAFELLDRKTLNIGWYGHPGSTVIYLLALIDAVLVLGGLAVGRFSGPQDFAAAVIADPALVWLPSRTAFALIGAMVVVLTFLVGRRLFGLTAGIAAAAIVTLNTVHVIWSQVIRTDIPSSLFMLTASLLAIRFVQNEDDDRRSLVLAGLVSGMAIATKWPAGAALLAPFLAIVSKPDVAPRQRSIAVLLLAASTLAGIALSSPFIFLDWPSVVRDINGEVVTGHLGQSSQGPWGNFLFYADLLVRSSGWAVALLLLLGMVACWRQKLARLLVLPTAGLLLGVLLVQPQVWARWLTPLIPYLAIIGGAGASALAGRVRALAASWSLPTKIVLASAIVLPGAAATAQALAARTNDTRTQAARWAAANIPPGKTILVEHFALDLRGHGWLVLFPLGQQGCVDGENLLNGKVSTRMVNKARAGSPIVDIGHLPVDKLAACRADYAILTYYDQYLRENSRFPREFNNYKRLLLGSRTVALFRTDGTMGGGPITRVVALKQQR